MRQRFYTLEHLHGFRHLDQWKAHWDRQLYKALEHRAGARTSVPPPNPNPSLGDSGNLNSSVMFWLLSPATKAKD